MPGGFVPEESESGEGWKLLAPAAGLVVHPGRNSLPLAVKLTAPAGFSLQIRAEPEVWASEAFAVPPVWNESHLSPGREASVQIFSFDPLPVRIPPQTPIARIVPTTVWTASLPVVAIPPIDE